MSSRVWEPKGTSGFKETEKDVGLYQVLLSFTVVDLFRYKEIRCRIIGETRNAIRI